MYGAGLEQIMNEFAESKKTITDLHRSTVAETVTATSKNRAISVTVDGRGEVVGMKFHNRAYRTMAPAQLAALLIETISEARHAHQEAVGQALAAILPASVPVMDLLRSDFDAERMMEDGVAAVLRESQRGE